MVKTDGMGENCEKYRQVGTARERIRSACILSKWENTRSCHSLESRHARDGSADRHLSHVLMT